MYDNPKQRVDTFIEARRFALSLTNIKLRKKFQTMILDSDPLMYVLAPDELRTTRRSKKNKSTSVSVKQCWSISDLNNEIYNGNLSEERILFHLEKLGVISKSGEMTVMGKQVNASHFYECNFEPDNLMFSAKGKDFLRKSISDLRAEKTKRENLSNGIEEMTEIPSKN